MTKDKFLTNELREHLLSHGLGKVAVAWDLALSLDLTRFSVSDLVGAARSAGVAVSERLVRSAVAAGVFRCEWVATAGRPVAVYSLPGVSAYVRLLGLVGHQTTDDLHLVDCRSLAAYRAALHRAFLSRLPGRYSRAFLSGRLGLSKCGTLHYEDDSFVVEQSFSFVDVTESIDVRVPLRKGQGGEFLLVCSAEDADMLSIYGGSFYHRRSQLPGRVLPANRFLAWAARRAGLRVLLVRQRCNRYSVRCDYACSSWDGLAGEADG